MDLHNKTETASGFKLQLHKTLGKTFSVATQIMFN